MSLNELTAIESAYRTLEQLDDAGRRRALQWLTDALGERKGVALNGAPRTAMAEPHDDGAKPAARGVKRIAVAGRATKATVSAKRGRGADSKSVPAKRAGKRVRRARPDAEEIMAAYGQVGTISGLADHFEVPTYTVYSWARSLRQQGYEIGRS